MTNVTIIGPGGQSVKTNPAELQAATRAIKSALEPRGTLKRCITEDKSTAKLPEQTVPGQRILAFVERIERLESERRDLAEDVKAVYGELKALGFDAKTIRRLVRLRRMDGEDIREQTELLRLYAAAIGMSEQLCLF